MRNRLVHFSQFAAFILLLSGHSDGAPSSEATTPDPADPPASSSAVGGTEIVRFKARGSFAGAGFTLEQPGGKIVWGDISVQRGCDDCEFGSPGKTLLFYSVSSCDPVECVEPLHEFIGTIPNENFIVRGNVSTLRINRPSGSIVFQWTRTNTRVSDLQMHRRTRLKGVEMTHERFSLTSSSAIASGTLFDLTIKPVDGGVGTTRSGTIVISKVP